MNCRKDDPTPPPNNGQIRKISFAENLSKKFANFRAFFPRVANKSLRKYRRFDCNHVTDGLANRRSVLTTLDPGPGCSQRVPPRMCCC